MGHSWWRRPPEFRLMGRVSSCSSSPCEQFHSTGVWGAVPGREEVWACGECWDRPSRVQVF